MTNATPSTEPVTRPQHSEHTTLAVFRESAFEVNVLTPSSVILAAQTGHSDGKSPEKSMLCEFVPSLDSTQRTVRKQRGLAAFDAVRQICRSRPLDATRQGWHIAGLGAAKKVKKTRRTAHTGVDSEFVLPFIGALCGALSASAFDGQHLLDFRLELSAG